MNVKATTECYQRAQAVLQGLGTKSLVQNDTLFPHWIENTDYFWYERAIKIDKESTVKIGKEFRLVDAKAASNSAAFDHDALAQALAQASGQTVDKEDLPISSVDISLAPLAVSFVAFDQHWLFASDNKPCQAIEIPIIKVDEVLSPDGKRIAFVRDYNVWLRDVDSGEEWAVTFGGEEDYGYGGGNTAMGLSLGQEQPALWSPDSTGLLTVLRDKRNVQAVPMVDPVPTDGSIRPTVHFTKVAYPGDEQVETFQLIAIDINTNKTYAADYPPIATGSNSFMGAFFSRMAWWANDNQNGLFHCSRKRRQSDTFGEV